MSRVASLILVAGVLASVGACEAGKPPAPEPDKAASAPAPAPAPAPTPAPDRSLAPIDESVGPAAIDSAPPWFDAAKIEHTAVVNQLASEGTIAGGRANALILELAPGTTPAQCMAMARAALDESLPDVPEASASPDGRLTLQGKTPDYHYTVVCGDAKGKPTVYLSYTTK